jgi:membrane-associated protease RseP (regulator of RpoE activity)
MTVLFMDGDEKVYARYCGRDVKGPDERQSLEGLRYTMKSVLDMHNSAEKLYAPRVQDASKTTRDIAGGFRRGCYHCHQVKEAINASLRRKGTWDREMVHRFPMPDNLGLFLEVNRGNVVERVAPESAAAKAGLQKGDVLSKLGDVPIHSIADAQTALDRAAKKGTLAATWKREGQPGSAELTLAEGWKKSDITWRPSMTGLVPSLFLYGDDLMEEEKKVLGLAPKQVAFRQKKSVPRRAMEAGILGGDIIIGVDDRKVEGDVDALLAFVRREYLIGDRVTINVIRDGKRMNFPLTLSGLGR